MPPVEGEATEDDDLRTVGLMLLERGYDPAEWQVVSLTVNQWQAPNGDEAPTMLHQTKAHLVPVVPPEDTAWGRFETLIGGMPARQRTGTRSAPNKAWDRTGGITVLIGDDQAPFVNWRLHEALLAWLKDTQPDRIIYMGDGCDFDSVSKYTPKHPEWMATLQQGVDVMYRVLVERLEAAGYPPMTYLPGNHDHRLQEYLLRIAPELFNLRQGGLPLNAPRLLSISNLLRFDGLGIEYANSPLGDYPYPEVDIAPGFYATHGDKVRTGAGASVRAEIERVNASVAMGHTHRLALTHLSRWVPRPKDRPELIVYTGVETGVLSDPYGLGYAKNPDWQPGFAYVTHRGDDFQVNLVRWNPTTEKLVG